MKAAIHTGWKSDIAPVWVNFLFAEELDEVRDRDIGCLQYFGEKKAL